MSLQELVTICVDQKFQGVAAKWVEFFGKQWMSSTPEQLARIADHIRPQLATIRPQLATMSLQEAEDQVLALFYDHRHVGKDPSTAST